MFIGYIATFVALLVAFAYMASTSSLSNSAETRINFTKVKFVYPKEKVLVTGVESLCQSNGSYCKGKEVSGTITLTLADLNGYIPTSFVNDNGIGGTFGNILITNSYTTITIQQTIPKSTSRYVYLHYYAGSEFGSYPECLSGNPDQKSPCDSTSVIHEYPSSLDFRVSLENS